MRRIGVIAVLLAAVLAAGFAVSGCSRGPSAADLKAKCFANEAIAEAEMKLFKEDSGIDAPLKDVLEKLHLACPSGGTYSYDPATGFVTCSVHGHHQ